MEENPDANEPARGPVVQPTPVQIASAEPTTNPAESSATIQTNADTPNTTDHSASDANKTETDSTVSDNPLPRATNDETLPGLTPTSPSDGIPPSPAAPSTVPAEATTIETSTETTKATVNTGEDDSNLLEASSYQPREEEPSPNRSHELPKRKHTALDDRYKKIKKKKTGQHFFETNSMDGDDDLDDDDGAAAGDDDEEEDDDDFDEDDDEEFELERLRMKAAAEGFQKEYESDVDDSLGELSDEDDVSAILKHKSSRLSSNQPDPSADTLNLNDILEGGINLDKTVQLEDLMDNPDDLDLDGRGVSGNSRRSKSRRRNEEFQDDNMGEEDDDIDMDYELTQKLKDMGEISLEPLSKNESQLKRDYDLGDEVSLEITKKSAGDGGSDTEDKRKITNLRKNIREVMDDNQLDASTLAAQRQELERLARVQEQQRMLRDAQRQIAMERQNSKTQNRVLSLLQGKSGSGPSTSSLASLIGPMKIKIDPTSDNTLQKAGSSPKLQSIHRANLTPSVSIAPVRPPASIQKSSTLGDSSSEGDEDSQPIPDEASPTKSNETVDDAELAAKNKKDVVTIVDSSDDDCIMLSDDEEEPEDNDDPHNSGLHVNDAYNVPDDQGRIVVNIGHPEGEADIFVAPQIARTMKPHQIGGVRFLFDNIIESVDRFNSSTGFGCILAHSMGLGKTLQLVCFCDIFLRHTSSKTILCIMPINTLQNWMAEFNMWLPDESDKHTSKSAANGEEVRCRNFNLFVLNDTHKTLNARSKVVLDWSKNGGVLLMGYELYRLLSMKKVTKKRGRKVYRDPEVEKEEAEEHMKLLDEMHAALVKPGPDLCVCDEGHRIKNSHAGISIALKQMKSKRRIVLTGYPLQNNLLEYWCMVDFVRPNYLGTKTEFCNMFERPIQNGQCIDSTPQDIKLMRYRAHVLHSLLLGFVQRRSHVVLQNSLPVKEEFVLLVRMTEFQRKLYEVFMNEVVRTKAVPNPLKAFAVCCKIWNHPDVLYNFLKKREADLDLEEAEAAANDPSYEPIESGASVPGKKGKKTTIQKEKKTKGSKGKKAVDTTPPVVVPAITPTPAPEIKSEIVPPAEVTPNPEPIEIKKEVTVPPVHDNAYHQPPQTQYHPYPPPHQDNYNNYNNYDYYNNPYPNSYPNSNYPNYNQPPGGYPSHYQQPPPHQPHGPPHQNHQYPSGEYWNQSNNHQNNYYPNNEYNQQYNSGYNSGYSNEYQQHGGNYSQQYSQPHQPYPNQHPPADPWSTNVNHPDVKPVITNQSGSQDTKLNSHFVDLDTKEIKIENPMSLNLEIAKIEDKSAIKVELPTSVEDFNDPVKAKAEPATSDEKTKQPSTVAAEEVKDEATPSTDAKDATKTKGEDGIPYDWAVELMKNYVPDLIENSPKMEIFFCILEESLRLQDRMLVFSQSLLTLNLIEKFLQANFVNDTDVKWAKNLNYYRLDGSTAAMEREKLINEFNVNLNVHLFLVSTRAGSLGINLVGANRVVVFDASWNPCHDTQAVCRVYRYGQQKPCFVYRLVMDSCLEKKIYDRQVNKQGMSDRVVDESNPDAHLSMKEVTNLCYDDEKESEIKDFSDVLDKYTDIAARKIITKFSKLMTKEPFQHEAQLIDRKEKKLSMTEKRLAQRGYELEKQAALKPNYMSPGTQYRTVRTPDGAIVHRPVASVRPMQADLGGDRLRTGGITRATRWIPAEVWQRQGMTAQVLTLPGDVVIPTSSAEKSNIVLKEGQKVMVLKSAKGIYMQLETGKIIAIRTAFKMGQPKDKSNPTGLIGRDFTPKRLTGGATGTTTTTAPNTAQKPLAGTASSAVVPMSLKNNSSISITSNKAGIGPRVTNLPLGHQARGATSGAVRPFGGAGAAVASRPVSLLNNKPRPMMMQKGMANQKPVQLGTARPYNHKQMAGRMAPGPASSKIAPPTYTMSSSSSNSNSSFDVDSMNHEDSTYYGMAKSDDRVVDGDDDVTEIIESTEIVDSDNEKSGKDSSLIENASPVVGVHNQGPAIQSRGPTVTTQQDDDVIMVEHQNPYGSGPNTPASNTNMSSSSSTTSNYNKSMNFPGQSAPANVPTVPAVVPPVPNQPYYGYDSIPQTIQPYAAPHQTTFDPNSSHSNVHANKHSGAQNLVQQSAAGLSQQLPQNPHQMVNHSSMNHNHAPYPYHASSDVHTAQPVPISHSYQYPQRPPTDHPSAIGHSYPYSATGSVMPPSSLPKSSILIDDDIDQPLREKVVYKPNLIERKPKASKKDAKPTQPPYPAVSKDFRNQPTAIPYSSQKSSQSKDIEKPVEPALGPSPQLHQPFLPQSTQPRYGAYSKQPYANPQYHPNQNPYPNAPMNVPSGSGPPSLPTPPSTPATKMNRGTNATTSSPSGLHKPPADYGMFESNSSAGNFNHIHHAANQPLHPHSLHQPHGMSMDQQHHPEPSSLSFLERTASSIQDRPSAFNMSLHDITKPPAIDTPTLHSGSSNSNSVPSPSMTPSIHQPPEVSTPTPKSKAKSRSKATPATKKPAVAKAPAEPKVPKEKPPPKSKKGGAKNNPVPATAPSEMPQSGDTLTPQHHQQPMQQHPPVNSSYHHPEASFVQQQPQQQQQPPQHHQHPSQQPPHQQQYQHPPQATPPPQHQPNARPNNPPSNGSSQHPINNHTHHSQQSYQPTSASYPNYGHQPAHYPSGYPPAPVQSIPPPHNPVSHQPPPVDTYGSHQPPVSAAPSSTPTSHQQPPYDAYNMGYSGYHPAPGLPNPGPGVPPYQQPPGQYDQMYGHAPPQPPATPQHHSTHQIKQENEEPAINNPHPSVPPPTTPVHHSHTTTPSTTTDPHPSYGNSQPPPSGYPSHPSVHHPPSPYGNHHLVGQPPYLPPTGTPYHNYPPPAGTYPPAPPQGYNYAQQPYGGAPPAFVRPHQQQPPPQGPPPQPAQQQPGAYPPTSAPLDNPYGGYPPPQAYQNYPPYGSQSGQW